MEFREFEIAGPFEIIPAKLEDDRGYFSEIFRLKPFCDRAGPTEFVQDNQSFNISAGTVRGIHFQSHPAAQGKLVRCQAGMLLDVAVDLRADSATYGRWVSAILSPNENNQMWIPVGFGHAYCSLEPDTILSYRVTKYYSPENDLGLAWDDPDVGIEWPAIADFQTLSAKDRTQPKLAELPVLFSIKDR